MAVDIEGLRGPEEQDGKEVGTRDESNNQGAQKNPRALQQAGGKHGVFGESNLPDDKSDQEKYADNQGRNDMRGFPFVLFTISWVLRLL